MKSAIFIISPLSGAAAERVLEIQREFDPKLAASTPPHITITGSSGVGPIPPRTPVSRLREALEPIAASTKPITVSFGPPIRFMQTEYIVLPIDPHGPLRTLHERIALSGLPFEPARYVFTPHCTLSFYRTLTRDQRLPLLALRVTEPVIVDRIEAHLTSPPQPSRKLLELPLTGTE